MSTKRQERVKRFQPVALVEAPSYGEHINAIGMVFSLVGLLMRVRIYLIFKNYYYYYYFS